MKNISQILTSTLGRTSAYLSVFIVGSALHELLSQLIRPAIQSNSALVLTLVTLGAFIVAGALPGRGRRVISRLTSAATLFILGLVALRIGHSVIADPYLLLVALGVALIGAQPKLHRQIASMKQALLYSLFTIFITLVVAVTFAYGMTVLDRIVIGQQYDLHD